MAIIPKGRFQKLGPSSVARPNLPDDGAAKPYQALAQLGDTMAGVGAEMYKREKQERIATDVNKAKTEYATRSAATKAAMQDGISDEGNIGDKTYAEAYTEQDQADIDDISEKLTGSARTAFLQGVASPSRTNRVGSIEFQTKHRNARFKTNFKQNTTTEAGSISLDDDNVSNTAYEAFSEKRTMLQQKQSIGTLNEGTAKDLTVHAGESYAKAAADSVVLNRNIKEFNSLFGITLLRGNEMKEYIEENGLEEEAGKINKAFVSSADDARMEELTDFLTSREKKSYIKQMLTNMKQQNTLNKKALNTTYQQLRATIGNTETKYSDISSNVATAQKELLQQFADAGETPAEIAVRRSFLEADRAVKIIGEETALMPDHRFAREINKADDKIQSIMGTQNLDPRAVNSLRKRLNDTRLKQQAAIKAAPGDYVFNHSQSAQHAFKGVSATQPKGLKGALNITRLLQTNLRVPPYEQEMPSQIMDGFAFDINRAMQQPGGAEATKIIVGLQAELGDGLPSFLNNLADKNKLEGSPLSVISWIKDPVLIQENLSNVISLKVNKKIFDEKNAGRTKKKNIDKIFLQAADSDMDAFLQVHTKNGARRRQDLTTLVKARFYKDMTGKDLKESKAVMKNAYKEVIGKIYTRVDFGKSNMMIPKSYGLDKPTIKAAAKVMKNEARVQALSGQIDFDRMPLIKNKYKGFTDQRRNEKFIEDFEDKMRVLHPASDTDSGVLRLYMDTTSGRVAVPFKPTANNSAPVKEYFLKGLEDDDNIINQKAEDAKGFFNFGGE